MYIHYTYTPRLKHQLPRVITPADKTGRFVKICRPRAMGNVSVPTTRREMFSESYCIKPKSD